MVGGRDMLNSVMFPSISANLAPFKQHDEVHITIMLARWEESCLHATAQPSINMILEQLVGNKSIDEA